MGVEDDNDLAGFFDPADFGSVITWQVGNAGAVAVKAIFDNGHVMPGFGDDEPDTVHPQLTLATSAIPSGGGVDDTVIVAGAGSYKVRSLRPDGTGVSVIRLEKM